MTYNIRYDNPEDGPNAWSIRKAKVFDIIKENDPDILGVQEALYHQVKELTAARDNMQYVGVGRDDGRINGEFSPIIFKKERFDLQEQGTFWLSETPDIPGSIGWDAQITRVATWALLIDKETARKILAVNTHFDHVGEQARQKSAELIKEKIVALDFEVPVIITGDFNFTREENPYFLLTDGMTVELIDPAPEITGTYCTFEVGTECKAIDYIFVTNEWNADGYTVIQDNDGTYFPSDHLPVMISLSLME
ncbi:MAG TPA: endonuclease/exonuclease/phosphatase family protein [Chryseosolibacter sp.]|nr:endonuclease/exonuclease/phosphatase family protein [Chryseosolibacter sp.]